VLDSAIYLCGDLQQNCSFNRLSACVLDPVALIGELRMGRSSPVQLFVLAADDSTASAFSVVSSVRSFCR
jgi:hypothetical protein